MTPAKNGSDMFLLATLIALYVFLFDQWSKWYFMDVLHVAEQSIAVTSFFNLVMVWNRGISFGMFNEAAYSHYLFSGVAITIMLFLLHWLKSLTHPFPASTVGLIVGGAAGNIADRLRFGAVADFFDFHLAGWHWPAFNIADAAVFTGAVMLCMYMVVKKESC